MPRPLCILGAIGFLKAKNMLKNELSFYRGRNARLPNSLNPSSFAHLCVPLREVKPLPFPERLVRMERPSLGPASGFDRDAFRRSR